MRRLAFNPEKIIWVIPPAHHPAVSPINNRTERERRPLTQPPSLSDIYIFGIGAEIDEAELRPLTAGTGNNHFFKMKSIENLQETFDDIIGGPPSHRAHPAPRLGEAGF